ncbi:hypothetical protein AB0P44_41645 [Streptomyces chartreusis]
MEYVTNSAIAALEAVCLHIAAQPGHEQRKDELCAATGSDQPWLTGEGIDLAEEIGREFREAIEAQWLHNTAANWPNYFYAHWLPRLLNDLVMLPSYEAMRHRIQNRSLRLLAFRSHRKLHPRLFGTDGREGE